MNVDIGKVKVGRRIRKDFGNIQELADDIKENGLINPPVVNKDYELLAGERRLRACKLLGWQMIPVTMMDTRDAEHELNIEISENEFRQNFSKAERVDYMKRLMRIEEARAKERMVDAHTVGVENSPQLGRTRDNVAGQFGISSNTLRREITIADNRELLDPSDFADWDEGKLSTNKAYKAIKAKLAEEKMECERLSAENEQLKNRKPEVIEKVVEKRVEVVPDNYESIKKENAFLLKERQKAIDGQRVAETKLKELEEKMREPEAEREDEIKRSAIFFCAGVSNFIERYGGYIWLSEEINNMEASEREGYMRAVNALKGWIYQMEQNIQGV